MYELTYYNAVKTPEVKIKNFTITKLNSLLIQATMELVESLEMPGWQLPENCQIILTNNPEEGYNVQSTDDAQKTRRSEIVMKWDVKDWAEMSEEMGVDSRC